MWNFENLDDATTHERGRDGVEVKASPWIPKINGSTPVIEKKV